MTLPPTVPPVTVPSEADWPPQLVAYSPAFQEETALDGTITLRFDQPMAQESVQAAFKVSTATAVDTPDNIPGNFTWPRPDTMVFTPANNWERGQVYYVNLDSSAQSVNAIPMAEPVALTVQTVGFLEVSQLTPAEGARDIATDSVITVAFNRPVVPLVATTDQDQLPNPLTISPEVDGRGEWVSTSIYQFVPTAGLAGGTSYNVTVNAGLTDVMGGVLATAVSHNFSTIPPQLVNSIPYPDQTGVDPTAPFTLTFNMPMDTASVATAVSLRPNVPLRLTWRDNDTVLGIQPQSRLELGTRYELSLNQTARSANGQATLDQSYSLPFTTVPYPAVRSSEPNQGERAYPPENNGVYFDFASPMAWESFVEEIIIEPTPEPGKLFLDYYPGSTWLGIRFPLAPQTDYLVQIPASAADPYGNTLGEPFVLRFRTGDYAPFYTPSLPQFVNHFSTSFPTAVAFLQRNTQQIDVALYQADPDFATLGYHPDQLPATPRRTWQLRPDSASNSAAPLRLELNDGAALPTGIYYLTTLSDEERRNEYDPRVYLLVVGETNLVLKQMVDGVHVWAVDLATGLPASGLRLSLWDDSGRQLLEPINTDNNGWAKFDYVPERYYGYLTVMANTPGEPGFGLSNSNWSNGADPWQMNLPFNPGVEEAYTSYVFTDRPLYRPGDTVYVKGYVRLNDYGRFALPSQTQVRVELTQTGFYGESEPFQQELMLPLNELGGFDGEFVLPAGGQLGTYALTVTTPEGTYLGGGSITVAEFRKPELEVSVSTAVSATLRNQPSQATVQATYFFGGPAANLPVNYEVSDAPFVPNFDLPYSFGMIAPRPWYFYDQYSPDNYDGATLFSGEGTTDAQGQLIINLPADLLANSPAGSRQINLQATVMDVSNQIVAGRTSQIHHSAEVYVGVQLEGQSLFRANQEIPVNLISVNWDGQIVPNQPVTVRYYQQTWVRNPETGYSEAVDIPVGQNDVTTDSEGEASTTFVPTEAGSYWAEATITDGGGRTQQSAIWFWVSGDDPAQWQPSDENRTMPLVADKEGYIVGETAQILVQSPFTSPVQAWVTVERGGMLRQTLVTLNSNSEIINIPLTAEDAPNVFVAVTAVKGVTDDPNTPFADMRLGVIELPVDPDPFLLRLSLVPQATQWEPGETATFALTLTDANGQPIVGDVTLALVDKALLSLAPPNSPNIVEAFYGRQPYRTVIGASLLMSAEGVDLALLEELEKSSGGDMALGAVAESEEMMVMDAMPAMAEGAPLATPAAAREAGMGGAENTAVRSDFQDTAYWQASLTTDSNGQATIEIPLPDNLTTWQLHAKAMTADTLVGQADSEITVQKPLLLRPITPRFFVLGDVLELGTAINNNSDTAQETLVTLQAVGVTVQSPLSQTVTVLPGQSAVVRWTVAVNQLEAREVDLTLTAVSDQYSDATKPTFGFGDEQLLPIYRYNAQDIVGTSGVLPPDQPRRVEALLLPQGLDPELGNFTVYFNGSLAAVVLDSVQAVNVDPENVANPECAHQVAYQLLPNGVTARALRLLDEPNTAVLNELDQIIPRDIDLITGLQKEDGGWGWCASLESDPGFTAYILLALDKAQEAGYSVPPATISQAATYLRQQISNPARLENSPYQATYEAYFLYVLAEVGEDVTAVADELFNENRTLLDTAGLAFLLHAYTLNGGSPNQATLLADLNGRAVVSATGAHWESALGWGGLWSDVQTTAVVLHALVATEPDTTFGPQAVRWLIKVRQGQLWRTRFDSSWVLLALTDWMVSTGELEADFAYSLWVNGGDTAVQTGSFSRDSITRTDKLQLPLSQLNPDDTNFFDFQRNGTSGNLYYNAYLDSFIAADLVPPLSRGMTVQRTYYLASCTPTPETPCEPLTTLPAGQQIRVELTLIAHNNLTYVVLEDYFPAGAEAIDPGLLTSPNLSPDLPITPYPAYGRGVPSYRFWGWWYFHTAQYRDDRVVFTSEYLPAGSYTYQYTLQAVIPGTYQVRPTFARQEFFPEVNGRAEGMVLQIEEAQ